MRPEVPAVNEAIPPVGVDRMPTLTEVLELEAPRAADEGAAAPFEEAAFTPEEARPIDIIEPRLDGQVLVNEVLAELLPRIDMLFESRLREALAPALARAAEGLIRDARSEVGSALHELVHDAVQRALQRRGGRW